MHHFKNKFYFLRLKLVSKCSKKAIFKNLVRYFMCWAPSSGRRMMCGLQKGHHGALSDGAGGWRTADPLCWRACWCSTSAHVTSGLDAFSGGAAPLAVKASARRKRSSHKSIFEAAWNENLYSGSYVICSVGTNASWEAASTGLQHVGGVGPPHYSCSDVREVYNKTKLSFQCWLFDRLQPLLFCVNYNLQFKDSNSDTFLEDLLNLKEFNSFCCQQMMSCFYFSCCNDASLLSVGLNIHLNVFLCVCFVFKPGASLEQTHIFVLAHILRRPIIVYGVKYYKSFRGETLGYTRFQGKTWKTISKYKVIFFFFFTVVIKTSQGS